MVCKPTIRSHAFVCEISRPHGIAWHYQPVQIDHGGADFPYLQLAERLRERIRSGEFGPGAKLPTIAEIVSETGLSPMTIRRAVAVLAEEGLVRVVPGRGTFVSQA